MKLRNVTRIVLAPLVGISIAGTANPTEVPQKVSDEPSPTTASYKQTIAGVNITGVWVRYPAPWPEDVGNFDDIPPPKPGPVLKEPYATQWKEKRAKRAAAWAAGTPLVDPSTRCLPEGMPTIMLGVYPIQILQTPGEITVLAELFSQTRRIYVDRPFVGPDVLGPSYNGFSSARWAGDVLTITTTGVRNDVEFLEIPHGDRMVITERIQLTAPDMLKLDMKIEDPDYLKTPYEFTWVYKRDDKYRITEYICDGRRDVITEDGTVDLQTM
jgi:hypothetical protein